jgi:uncharacterized membrane protein YphA (DoxX/SURF4 family)
MALQLAVHAPVDLRSDFSARLERVDAQIAGWLGRHGIALMRAGMGVVYLWFGALKFIPGASPAQDLAVRTIDVLTFGLVPAELSILLLASWECLIGLALISGRFVRLAVLALLLQMLGTTTPLLFFPSETFVHPPFAPTLEGQYILKNVVLVTAALVVGAAARGERMVAGSLRVVRPIERRPLPTRAA